METKNNLDTIMKCPLFENINANDIKNLLKCLNAKERVIPKDSFIFSAGDKAKYVCIILSGSACIIQEDYWGNRTIVSIVNPGELCGEAFSYSRTKILPVSVIAREDCRVMFLNCGKIIDVCPNTCSFHSALIQNMLGIISGKNIILTKKIQHLTRKTTHEKVLSYLSECASAAKSNTFEIPFNRQELADYLSVERSALSATLSKMKKEGYIDYSKNKFHIIK